MGLMTAILLGFSGLFVGFLIGGFGIGGVLLLPILTYLFSVEIHTAIAAAMFGYVFSGLVGTIVYNQKGTIRWSMAFWLILGGMPSAFLGATVASEVPGFALEALIAIFILFAGARSLTSKESGLKGKDFSKPLGLIVVGFITGFGSSLTGTGGPLILVPILVSLKLSAHVAVGLSQAIQLPIAILASVGNYMYGLIDPILSGIIAGGLTIGATIGAKIAHKISSKLMSKLVSWILLATGVLIVVKLLMRVSFLGMS